MFDKRKRSPLSIASLALLVGLAPVATAQRIFFTDRDPVVTKQDGASLPDDYMPLFTLNSPLEKGASKRRRIKMALELGTTCASIAAGWEKGTRRRKGSGVGHGAYMTSGCSWTTSLAMSR